MRWAGQVARKRKDFCLCVFVRNSEVKRLLGRPRRRWVDNIEVDLAELGWDVMDLIGLAQDRGKWRSLVNAVMKIRVP
jgi:hypothetical protein